MKSKKLRKAADWSSWGDSLLANILAAFQAEVRKNDELRRLCSLAGLKPSELPELKVELGLLGNAKMAELNRIYRDKPVPTDVLSFPSPPIFRQQGLLGELLICLPVLRRQAKERKHSEETEFQVLLVHGVLHLLGLDHEMGDAEAAQMAKWEAFLLTETGVKLGPRTVSGLVERTLERTQSEEPKTLKRGATLLRKKPSKRWTVESP